MTRMTALWCILTAAAATANAADPTSGESVAPVPQTRPRQVMTATAGTTEAGDAAKSHSPTAPEPTRYVAEAKWLLAGYNNNEVVYTIIVTSQDTRIIRCVTDVKGTYIDNGKKLNITDRQTTTVFPNQPTQVGNWMDLDQESGAVYTVKCHAA